MSDCSASDYRLKEKNCSNKLVIRGAQIASGGSNAATECSCNENGSLKNTTNVIRLQAEPIFEKWTTGNGGEHCQKPFKEVPMAVKEVGKEKKENHA